MTESRFRLIIFDFDGTIVDSQHFIHDAYSAAFEAHDLEPPSAEATRHVIGLRLDVASLRLLPEGSSQDLADSICQAYRDAFFRLRAEPDFEEPLFPGARETLKQLNSPERLLGIATGKNRRGLLHALNHHDLTDHFIVLKTSDDGPSKPHPELLHQAMAEMGAECAETVFIGDTTYDMEMAVNAGVTGLGVAWGYHAREALTAAGAARILEGFAELPRTLDELGGAL